MSRALPKYNKRRVVMIGGASAVVLSAAVIAGSALAGESHDNAQNATTKAAANTVNCPAVAPSLPAIPASAKAEVDRNLALLNTQIAEANKRLVDTVGQGGANFVQNAILGPLKDKRASTIDRIAISIGRTAAKPTGLDTLAACTLNTAGAAAGGAGAASTAPSAPATAQAGGDASGAGAATAAGTITCPDVASQLPAVPVSAKAEVDRNLALLNTQIAEANTRLAKTVGQGGPNFVQNAILGPLKDKRASTIDRIAISIGRTAAKPTGLDTLAACTLTK
uniref:Secreted protein n=1 Tax=Streptomyces sp. NBC_01393 TaxID=2903851 RepID=A0AAU3HTM9_9ACTN